MSLNTFVCDSKQWWTVVFGSARALLQWRLPLRFCWLGALRFLTYSVKSVSDHPMLQGASTGGECPPGTNRYYRPSAILGLCPAGTKDRQGVKTQVDLLALPVSRVLVSSRSLSFYISNWEWTGRCLDFVILGFLCLQIGLIILLYPN